MFVRRDNLKKHKNKHLLVSNDISSTEDTDNEGEFSGELIDECDNNNIAVKMDSEVEEFNIANDTKNDQKDHKSKKLFCKSCDKVFSTKFNFQVHNKKKKHLCQFCQEMFCNKTLLSSHVKLKHRRKGYECQLCGNEFTAKQSLKTLIEFKTESNEYLNESIENHIKNANGFNSSN